MTQLDSFRQALANISSQVATAVPLNPTEALLQVGDVTALAANHAPRPRPGWNLALRLCLERENEDGNAPADPAQFAAWAERFLADCDQLALASLALAQCASGHLQLEQRGPSSFVAWATSRRLSAEQRERADFDWWSAHLAQQTAPHLAAHRAERQQALALLGREAPPTSKSADYAIADPTVARYYRALGQAHVARFACQHSYPPDATIGGATFRQYTEILALLIGWLYYEHDRRTPEGDHAPTPRDEQTLIAALAGALDSDSGPWGDPGPVEREAVRRALQPFILDRNNAAYHSALPGSAPPPLIRLDDARVVWSAIGLLSEPLIFLTRELRRRHAQEYHDSARMREDVFRQDLYRLFSDKRFVSSAVGVVLKRSGKPRTDVDALIFDRKTGTLGIFELKAQDPFARSVEERQRQRDSFFHANHQVSAVLEWVQRYGPDDLLVRFGERTAKRFHVQKVHVFVLGRYLAHFPGGPEPDRRAAWGSWPQVLQVLEDGSFDPAGRNPLGSLFARLRDGKTPSALAQLNSQEIAVGGLQLRIFPSFADMRATEDRR